MLIGSSGISSIIFVIVFISVIIAIAKKMIGAAVSIVVFGAAMYIVLRLFGMI